MSKDVIEITTFEKMSESISFNIRYQIMKKDLKVRQIFTKANCSYVHFLNVVNGYSIPSLECLCNIADAIECDIFDILKPISFN